MSKTTLTPEEKEYIKNNEAMIASIVATLDHVKQFKVDDVLIAFYPMMPWTRVRQQVQNSYGAPKKYKVVATDAFGVPYMKELNKAGNTVGQLISSIKYDSYQNKTRASMTYEFEVDPDLADAIILGDEEGFDPSLLHKEKADLFKAITEHNKSSKVAYKDAYELIDYLKTVNAGDVIWKSNKTSWTVLKPLQIITDKQGKIDRSKTCLEVQTSKGKILNLSINDIKGKALYRARPRTYGELRDPK